MEKLCGIYCILNKINKKRYIGQSINIYNRWGIHLSSLRGGYHRNDYLQNAFNKYGESNFEFYIVEICSDNKLSEYEIFWISYYDSFKNGYNLTIGGEGCAGKTCTDEERAEISRRLKGHSVPESARKRFREHMLSQFQDEDFIKAFQKNIDSQKTPVDCYNSNGYYCSYESIHDAANDLNLIATNICKVLKGKYKTTGEYTFCYSNELLSEDDLYRRFNTIDNSSSHKWKQNYLQEIDFNGNQVRVFNTIKEASKMYGLDESSISKVCRGKLKQTKGHIFRYLE